MEFQQHNHFINKRLGLSLGIACLVSLFFQFLDKSELPFAEFCYPSHVKYISGEKHHLEGKFLLDKQHYADAVTELQYAVSFMPDSASAQIDLGFALLRNKQINAAITTLQKATCMLPESPSAHLYLGDALNYIGRNTEAHEEWKKVVVLPEHEWAKDALSRLAEH